MLSFARSPCRCTLSATREPLFARTLTITLTLLDPLLLFPSRCR